MTPSNPSVLLKALGILVGALGSLLRHCIEWIGAPSLLAQLRAENEDLRARCEKLENRSWELEDRVMEKQGIRSFVEPESLPAPVQTRLSIEELKRQDILRELEELRLAAEADPDTFAPMLQEALVTYRHYLN